MATKGSPEWKDKIRRANLGKPKPRIPTKFTLEEREQMAAMFRAGTTVRVVTAIYDISDSYAFALRKEALQGAKT